MGVTASSRSIPGVTVAAPPSKSLSHRKIITSGLAKGVSTLSNVLESADTARTMDILSLTGATITRKGKGVFAIAGTGRPPRGGRETAPISCYLHESGTSARLLTAVLAAGNGVFRLHGAPRLHQRPMSDLFTVLESLLEAPVTYEENIGKLPAIIRSKGLSPMPGETFMPVSCDVSSQFLSGLLLAAPFAPNGLRLLLAGKKAVSWPYVRLTLQAMEEAGLPVAVETLDSGEWHISDWHALHEAVPYETRFTVPHGCYTPLSGEASAIEGDYSGASYLLAAGAAGPCSVTVSGLSARSLQGDAAILEILRAMGAGVLWNGNAVTISPGKLTGITRDMGDCPDLVPTVAALAALVEGRTVITGVAHLAEKESDRLAAPAVELAKIGCTVDIAEGCLTISPPAIKKAGGTIEFSAHNDHRMAMSLALLELAGIGVALDDPDCVAKSFPEFWEVWGRIHPATRIMSAD
jgi:3-phosphoshikimate 1-carboxyvinyltransferase